MKILRPCLVVLAAIAASFASAQTLSYTADFGDALNPIPVANFPQALTLPKFDSSLGTLTGVTLTLESTASTVISQVINLKSTPQTFTGAGTQLNLALSAPGLAALAVSPSAGPFSGVAAGPIFTITTAGSASLGALSNSAAVLPANLSFYLGTGVESYSVSVSGSVSSAGTSAPGAVAFFGDGMTYGHVTVDYAYTAIPEPSTWALLVGMATLAVAVRRNRSKQSLRA